NARLERGAHGAGLFRQTKGGAWPGKNAAPFFFCAIEQGACIIPDRKRSARAQTGRESARSGATGSLECRRSAGAFRTGDGRERVAYRAIAKKRDGSVGAAAAVGYRFLL